MSVPRPCTQIHPGMPPHQTLATPRLPMAEPAEEGRLKKGNSYTLHKAPCGRTQRGDIGGPVHGPHMRGNYLNINHKKCKFLYDEQSALRADSKRGYRWPCPRPHMNGNYLNIKHKKCKFLYD